MQNEKKIKFEIKSALFRCFWAVILKKKTIAIFVKMQVIVLLIKCDIKDLSKN